MKKLLLLFILISSVTFGQKKLDKLLNKFNRNKDYQVIDNLGSNTEKVHTFNKDWRKWLKKGNKIYEKN